MTVTPESEGPGDSEALAVPKRVVLRVSAFARRLSECGCEIYLTRALWSLATCMSLYSSIPYVTTATAGPRVPHVTSESATPPRADTVTRIYWTRDSE